MNDIIKEFSENMISTLVILTLSFDTFIIFLLAIIFFPFKKIRLWFKKQIIKILKAMLYYIKECEK